MTDKISITFDDENRIRVLEAEKFKDTETMKNECMEFIKSIRENLFEMLIDLI